MTPADASGVLHPLAALFLVVFAVGFVISAYVSGPAAESLARHPVQLHGLRHWGGLGLWVFGAGLFFFGMRALQINPLSFGSPVWLVISAAALVVFAVRCASWWRTSYPVMMESEQNRDGEGGPKQNAPLHLRARHS